MNKVVVSYCKFSTVSYAHLSRIWDLSTTEQHYLLIYPSPLFFGGLLIASSSYVWKQFPTTRSVFLSSIVEICLPVIILLTGIRSTLRVQAKVFHLRYSQISKDIELLHAQSC